MNPAAKKTILALVVIVLGYGGSYLPIRLIRADKNEKDGKTYVVFPNEMLAKLFKPMSALDAAITGAQAKVGGNEPAEEPEQ